MVCVCAAAQLVYITLCPYDLVEFKTHETGQHLYMYTVHRAATYTVCRHLLKHGSKIGKRFSFLQINTVRCCIVVPAHYFVTSQRQILHLSACLNENAFPAYLNLQGGQIDLRDHLCARMLYLQPRVQLEEIV